MANLKVRITNDDGTFAELNQDFNYQYPPPIAVDIVPSSGPAGTTVVITGSEFRGSTVTIGGVQAQVLSVTPNAITAVVPVIP